MLRKNHWISPAVRLGGHAPNFADTQLDGLKEFRFKAVLESKDIEAIKAEQKTLKEDYEKHLNKHKETLNQLRESEKSILSNHRDELKKIMRGESAWLSFKAWIWAIIIIEVSLQLVGTVFYLIAKAKFT